MASCENVTNDSSKRLLMTLVGIVHFSDHNEDIMTYPCECHEDMMTHLYECSEDIMIYLHECREDIMTFGY